MKLLDFEIMRKSGYQNKFDGYSSPTQKMNRKSKFVSYLEQRPTFYEEMEEFKARYEEEQAKKLAALKKQVRIAERKSRDYLTASNDNTWVEMNNGRVKNPHLIQRAVQGAKAHAVWEKEHPALTAWGNVLSATPFAVAAIPAVAGGAVPMMDAAASTVAGKAITAGLTPAYQAVTNSTWLPWLDAALTSVAGAHGIQQITNDGLTPGLLVEMAPLTRLTPKKTVRYLTGINKELNVEGFSLKDKLDFWKNSTHEKLFPSDWIHGDYESAIVKPTNDVIDNYYMQVLSARKYKNSPEYKRLVERAQKEAEDMGISINTKEYSNPLHQRIPRLETIDPSKTDKIARRGFYDESTNSITLDIDPSNSNMLLERKFTPYHEGLHWQEVGSPYDEWGDIRRYLDVKVGKAIKEDTKVKNMAYFKDPAEFLAHSRESGKAIGLKPFEPYPGIDKAKEAIKKARKYDKWMNYIKDGTEEEIKNFWNLLTGNYAPAALPIIGGVSIEAAKNDN